MVYTELEPRRQQFHVAPAVPALKYTTSVEIQKYALQKASHWCSRITCECSASAQESGEQRYINNCQSTSPQSMHEVTVHTAVDRSRDRWQLTGHVTGGS